jgi:hypothetical protein
MKRAMSRKMEYSKRFKHVLIILVIILIIFNYPVLGSDQPKEKSVLILYSLSNVFPVTAQWDKAIRSVLENQQDVGISVNTEHLDLSRYNDSDYIRMMVNILRYKYSKSKPDLIITVFKPALDFAVRNRRELFPDVPIIFGGIDRLSLEGEDFEPNISGIFHGANAYKKTLELIIDLHPDTRHALVVAGSGLLEQSWLIPARKTFNLYKDRIDFNYLSGLVNIQKLSDQ